MYRDVDLSRLVRFYAALSPSTPSKMPSPPFPTAEYLARTCNQIELFDLLTPLDIMPDGTVTETCRWKYAFWKRITQVIEKTLAEGALPGLEEEELYSKLLLHYISLQGALKPHDMTTSDTRRYFHGPLHKRSDWNCVTLVEDKASISKGTTGLRSWGASVCLANYLISNTSLLENRKVILELGSGTGLVGIVAQQLSSGATVYLTDVDLLVIERLSHNVALNASSYSNSPVVRTLDWNSPMDWKESPPDIILAADVVYDPTLILPLAQTLRFLLDRPTKPRAFLSATVRQMETWEAFITYCHSELLEVQSLPLSSSEDGIVAVDGLDQFQSAQLQLVELCYLGRPTLNVQPVEEHMI